MLRTLAVFSFLAAAAAAQGQAGGPGTSDSQTGASQTAVSTQQGAPIVRAYERSGFSGLSGRFRQQDRVVESQPVAGVWLRSLSSSAVKTVSAAPGRVEISLEHGKLNVDVHHPADHTEILIDLPGGQTSLLKNGLYTFNAETNTVRVLRGEAAFVGAAGANAKSKPVKIKEDHQLSLVAGNAKTVEAYPYELSADLLPREGGDGDYGDGVYPRYPYYAGGWRYPYGYFYPGYYAGFYPGYYAGYYGYPFGYGIGFGYYGGFGRYRGGFRR